MRFFTSLLIAGFVLCTNNGLGQTLIARYKITREVYATDNTGSKTQVASLPLTGYLYKKGNCYISFARPLYLDQYPGGTIAVKTSTDAPPTDIGLFMDTLQSISYMHFDSMIVRYRNDRTGRNNVTSNYTRAFSPGGKNWEYTNETKEINGLKCQKAKLEVNGRKIWDVWFCADIPMHAGPQLIYDLPGLVVEMQSFATNEKWTLENYNATASVSQSIFWPNEFKQAFQQLQPLKKQAEKHTASKTEQLKQIANQ
jgi:GLPGLI family protein